MIGGSLSSVGDLKNECVRTSWASDVVDERADDGDRSSEGDLELLTSKYTLMLGL